MKAAGKTPPPELVIFVPWELPEKEIARIKAKLDETVKVRFKVDPGLIGGAALAWEGIYKDYSIRATMEEKKTELEQLYKLGE